MVHDGIIVAAIVYQRRAHVINLFVASTANSERSAKFESVQGFNIRFWGERNLNYWAVVFQVRGPLVALSGHACRGGKCLLSGGDLNRSTQHLLILLDKEVADGDVTDIVHGEAEG